MNTIASKQTEVKYVMRGARGMLPYPAGEYNEDTTYTATANVAPYVLFNGTYYVMNKVGSWLGTSTKSDPQKDYAAYGQQATWIPFEEYKAVYVELLMARLGLIGKSVFWDNYTFSQKGVDKQGNPSDQYQKFESGEFIPNILIDWVEGTMKLLKLVAEGVDISGTVRSKLSYSPFVQITAGEIGNTGAVLDPLVIGGNIILSNSLIGPNYLRLSKDIKYAGVLIRIYEPLITRSDTPTVLVGTFPQSGEIETKTTFTPKMNVVIDILGVPREGSCAWVVMTPNSGTFSNDYK